MLSGRIDNFSCLVGVCLSDCLADNMGNLVVRPGSHWAMQDWLRDDSNLANVLEYGSKALPRAPTDWSLPLRPPTQVKMCAGDVVVAHYSLAHSIAPNTGGAIRYMIYFRLCTPDHAKAVAGGPSRYRLESIRDIFTDWPALRSHAAAAAREHRRDQPALAAEWSEMASLWPVSKELMAANQYADAAPILARLAELWPDDYEARLLAAASSLAVPGSAAKCLAHATAAAQLCAARWVPHCLVVKSLIQLGRTDEALCYVDRNILASEQDERAAAEAGWESELLVEMMGLLSEVRGAAGSRGKELAARVGMRFPELRPGGTPTAPATIAAAAGGAAGGTSRYSSMSAERLWEVGMVLVKSESKTFEEWEEARTIFGLLSRKQPQVFWAQLLAGICTGFAPASSDAAASFVGKLGGGLGRGSSPQGAREGACFAAAAIAIDPGSPLGYALLARCEWRCGDAGAAAAAAMGAAAHPGTDALGYVQGHEHAWLLLDAAKVGLEAVRGQAVPSYVVFQGC